MPKRSYYEPQGKDWVFYFLIGFYSCPIRLLRCFNSDMFHSSHPQTTHADIHTHLFQPQVTTLNFTENFVQENSCIQGDLERNTLQLLCAPSSRAKHNTSFYIKLNLLFQGPMGVGGKHNQNKNIFCYSIKTDCRCTTYTLIYYPFIHFYVISSSQGRFHSIFILCTSFQGLVISFLFLFIPLLLPVNFYIKICFSSIWQGAVIKIFLML